MAASVLPRTCCPTGWSRSGAMVRPGAKSMSRLGRPNVVPSGSDQRTSGTGTTDAATACVRTSRTSFGPSSPNSGRRRRRARVAIPPPAMSTRCITEPIPPIILSTEVIVPPTASSITCCSRARSTGSAWAVASICCQSTTSSGEDVGEHGRRQAEEPTPVTRAVEATDLEILGRKFLVPGCLEGVARDGDGARQVKAGLP